MTTWTGKSRGNLFGYQIFIFLLKYTHIYFAYFIVFFVSFYFYFFSDKKGIRYFYGQILKQKKCRREKSVFKNFFSFAKVLIDRIAILSGLQNKFSFSFENESIIRDMANDKRGGILVSGHIGNWEVAGSLFHRIETKIHVVMFDGERSALRDFLEKVKGNDNFNVIFIRPNDISHVIQIDNALKNGEIITMHGDRFMEGSKALTTNFIGQNADFPEGPFFLAAKYGVPLCFVSAIKDKKLHYQLKAEKPITIGPLRKPMSHPEEMKKLLNYYVSNLENVLTKNPYQWFNYYMFWKKQ